MEVMARLRLKGFELSLDDFGTGSSTLVQLHRMPFNELKIDRSFISEVARSRDAATIVRAMIELAHNLGLSTCAEGVEDRATHDFLLDAECDHGQGFFYGRPGHPDDLAGRLVRKAAAAL